jgi:hypothetical protein
MVPTSGALKARIQLEPGCKVKRVRKPLLLQAFGGLRPGGGSVGKRRARRPGGADTLLPSLSIADLAVGCQLQALSLAGEEIDASRWPRLPYYAAGLHTRPSFQKALG